MYLFDYIARVKFLCFQTPRDLSDLLCTQIVTTNLDYIYVFIVEGSITTAFQKLNYYYLLSLENR